MSESRRGLGRGLAALLEDTEPEEIKDAGQGSIELPIETIRNNPDQPRVRFPEEDLEALAKSILERGVVQPILVRPADGDKGYQIIAGERRWRAAQRAGLRTIPAIVRTLSDAEAMEMALVENVQRSDLNPLEEARGYVALGERFGRTQEDIAAVVGRSRSHVANTLRLLRLPAAVQEHVSAGRLSAGHARALIDLQDPESAARKIIERGLSVRQAEMLARRLRGPEEAAPRREEGTTAKDADTRDLETNLATLLGIGVEIKDRGGAGELRLKYGNLEQLDELCRRLSRPA
ncbi:MAG: ParB/RepB/Spo0J family partition protein [Caulobacteraceae bacterium]